MEHSPDCFILSPIRLSSLFATMYYPVLKLLKKILFFYVTEPGITLEAGRITKKNVPIEVRDKLGIYYRVPVLKEC